ncbi:AAA family ATPase [Piscibacillus salipiscarius]|uniref:AAA family ATPase n=1 Tax=Piscibacillus salipiscarius TaxID=299480 RepID=A0ABW5Q8B6_9BACI|nr:AAA family ATPase [Piscibacillus salipiscarius]
MSANSKVIAISGVSGSGKTTVTKALVQQLHNAKTFYFDTYDVEGPEDIVKWVEQGANYNEWDLSPLHTDIQSSLDQSYDYIILDYPFAYQNEQIARLIDCAIFIDTPLDVALARRIVRDSSNESTDEILNSMKHYLANGRKGYTQMLNTIKPDSDIIVEGNQSIDKIVEYIKSKIWGVKIG